MGDAFWCWTLGLQSGWGVKRHLRRLRVVERNYVRIFFFQRTRKKRSSSRKAQCFFLLPQHPINQNDVKTRKLPSGAKSMPPLLNSNSWGVVTAASFWRFLEGPLEGERQEGWEGSFPSVGKKGFYLNVLNSLFTTSDPQPRKTHNPTQNLLRLLPKGC